IKFYPPQSDARRKIWQVMVDQFELNVDAVLIDELVEMFPAATGRDIKGLAKLAAKFCHQKKVEPTAAVFQRCSTFRGMDLIHPAARS
ncbi:MAG: AAA family ATPase, partial [Ferrovum sp.]|nr:AAA family ATPase [Ferrovum sp.]